MLTVSKIAYTKCMTNNSLFLNLGWLNMKNVPDVLRQWYKQYGGIVKEIRAGHTVVHIFDPDLIRFVYAGEDKWPRIEPLLETTQLYRKQFDMSPGLGNT